MSRKLPKEAFYAQFHNHEKHLEAQDHERPFSHEVQDVPSRGASPDYSRKKKHHRAQAVHKAMQLTVGH